MAKPTGAEPTTPATVEPQTVAPAEPVTPDPTPSEPAKDAAWWESKAKAMEKEKEAAAKKLAKLEEAEQKRQDAELSETEKLKKQLADAEKKAAEAERKAIRQMIAAETGLPAVLAERLQGDDEEAMREDATKLLEALPKTEPAKKQNPNINPTNPAAAQQGETLAQKKARLGLTREFNLFTEAGNEALGGGVLELGQKGD